MSGAIAWVDPSAAEPGRYDPAFDRDRPRQSPADRLRLSRLYHLYALSGPGYRDSERIAPPANWISRFPGGAANRYAADLRGSADANAGQDYVLFLWTSKSGLTQVIGLSQGLFVVTTNASGQLMVTRAASTERMVNATGQPVTRYQYADAVERSAQPDSEGAQQRRRQSEAGRAGSRCSAGAEPVLSGRDRVSLLLLRFL